MQERQQFAKNRVFWPTSPAFDISVGMEKPKWLGYPMVKKNSNISLFVLAQFTNVTDGRTDRPTLHADIGRAYASHRAA